MQEKEQEGKKNSSSTWAVNYPDSNIPRPDEKRKKKKEEKKEKNTTPELKTRRCEINSNK